MISRMRVRMSGGGDREALPGNTDCQIFPFNSVVAKFTHYVDKSVDELFMKCI